MSNLEKNSEKATSTEKRGLGRGLGSLFGAELAGMDISEEKSAPKVSAPVSENVVVAAPVSAPTSPMADINKIWNLPIEKLMINNYQPRKHFEKDKIQELSSSIKEQGILQPIVARKSINGKFEIIAGERRWRAAQLAGLQEVPVILKDIDDQKSLELALIENIQRESLNGIEEAEAYDRLAKEFGLTQQEISQKVGKDRTTITNTLRLLALTPEVKNMLVSGEISTGHAKALLAITDPDKQREIAKKIASEKLTVRAAEKLAKKATKERAPQEGQDDGTGELVSMMAEDIQKSLGTKVKIDYSKGVGKISIFFYSDSELTQVSERLKKSWNPAQKETL